MSIYHNGEAIFPDMSHHLRDDLSGTFGFLLKRDSRLTFLYLHFEHSLFRPTVDKLDITGEDINWITEWGEEKNSVN